jgi:hypothetical protein
MKVYRVWINGHVRAFPSAKSANRFALRMYKHCAASVRLSTHDRLGEPYTMQVADNLGGTK